MPRGAAPELLECLRGFRRQALHAFRLRFAHPASGEPMQFEAPLPEDLQGILDEHRRAMIARNAVHYIANGRLFRERLQVPGDD